MCATSPIGTFIGINNRQMDGETKGQMGQWAEKVKSNQATTLKSMWTVDKLIKELRGERERERERDIRVTNLDHLVYCPHGF